MTPFHEIAHTSSLALSGCTVCTTTVTYEYIPTTCINILQVSGYGNANALHADDKKTLLIDGTEVLMILEFCARHNCTLEISLGWLLQY